MAFSANFALVLIMSGAKRRSGYRKGVEASLLHGDVEPEPGQRLALLLKSRGSNIMEVRVEPAAAAHAATPARWHTRRVCYSRAAAFTLRACCRLLPRSMSCT